MIINRPKQEIDDRSRIIRLDFIKRYRDLPALRSRLFVKQSELCPVCKRPLLSQDSVTTEVDHAYPVDVCATYHVTIEEACEMANAEVNLQLIHTSPCHTTKSTWCIDEYLERIQSGEVVLGAAPVYAPARIEQLVQENSARQAAAARKGARTLGPAGLSAKSKKAMATMGPAGLRARVRKAMETMGPAGLSARAHKRQQNLGPAGRKAIGMKIVKTKGRAGLSASAKKASKTRGPDWALLINHNRWHTNRSVINPNCKFCFVGGSAVVVAQNQGTAK